MASKVFGELLEGPLLRWFQAPGNGLSVNRPDSLRPEAVDPALVSHLPINHLRAVFPPPAGDPEGLVGSHLEIDRVEGPPPSLRQ